jgi:hypothetical protein
MVGVTIGVGEHYGRFAELAARAVEEKTRLRTIILRDSHFVFSRLPAPNYLKLRMFDFVDDDSILYFEANGSWSADGIRVHTALVPQSAQEPTHRLR